MEVGENGKAGSPAMCLALVVTKKGHASVIARLPCMVGITVAKTILLLLKLEVVMKQNAQV